MPRDLYQETVLADAPLAYYRFEETSGTSATDSSGNGYTGTINGPMALGQASLLASDGLAASYGFNGSSTYVNAPLPSSWPEASWSWECLVQMSAPSGTGAVYTLSGTGPYENGPQISIGGGAGNGVWIAWINAGWVIQYNPGIPVYDGNPHHVLVTAALASGTYTFTLYYDGVAVATATSTAASTGATTTNIGASAAATPTYYWAGGLSEVAFYTAALTGTQAWRHFLASRGLLYNCDQGTTGWLPSGPFLAPYTGALAGRLAVAAGTSRYLVPPQPELWMLRSLVPDANIAALALSDGTTDLAITPPVLAGRLLASQGGLMLKATAASGAAGHVFFSGVKLD